MYVEIRLVFFYGMEEYRSIQWNWHIGVLFKKNLYIMI